MKKALLLKSSLALALAAPLLASAESELVVGAGVADARLDFRVIIPRVLFLAVGTGSTGNTTNTTIDTLTFDYSTTAADVGSGTASAGQSVNVRVRGNNGQVALAATTTTGVLTNATADTIPWTQITSVSDQPTLPSPTIGAGSSNVTLNAGRVTDRSAVWTFSYLNTAVVAPGTYGTTDGRVTYTASMP